MKGLIMKKTPKRYSIRGNPPKSYGTSILGIIQNIVDAKQYVNVVETISLIQHKAATRTIDKWTKALGRKAAELGIGVPVNSDGVVSEVITDPAEIKVARASIQEKMGEIEPTQDAHVVSLHVKDELGTHTPSGLFATITDEEIKKIHQSVIREAGLPTGIFDAVDGGLEFAEKLQALAKEAAKKNAIQVQLAGKLSVEPDSSVLQDLINIATVQNLTDLINGAQDLRSLDHICDAIIKRPGLGKEECDKLSESVRQRRQEIGFAPDMTHLCDNIWEERAVWIACNNLELIAEPVTGEPDQPAMWGMGGSYPTKAIVCVYMGVKACEFIEAKAIYDLLKPMTDALLAPSFDEISVYCNSILLKQLPWLNEVKPPMVAWTNDELQVWLQDIESKYGSTQMLSMQGI